jgi:uncharacterized protein (DUF1697 family)
MKMAWVVLIRGVNVGRNKRFSPAALADDLSEWNAVNLGAAGTLVIRKALARKLVRDELRRRLPFEAEVMICRAKDVLEFAEQQSAAAATDKSIKPFVSVLSKPPRKTVRLPIAYPPGSDWQVRLVAQRGGFVLSHWRRMGKRMIYPNEVVEKMFGMPATSRNWNTLLTICRLLRTVTG